MTKQEIIKKYPFVRDLEITGYAYIRNNCSVFELIEIFDKSKNNYKCFMFIYDCGYFRDLEKYSNTIKETICKLFGLSVLDFENVKITNY